MSLTVRISVPLWISESGCVPEIVKSYLCDFGRFQSVLPPATYSRKRGFLGVEGSEYKSLWIDVLCSEKHENRLKIRTGVGCCAFHHPFVSQSSTPSGCSDLRLG